MRGAEGVGRIDWVEDVRKWTWDFLWVLLDLRVGRGSSG